MAVMNYQNDDCNGEFYDDYTNNSGGSGSKTIKIIVIIELMK